ncbi:DUF2254 domain-containing protein [Halomonas sp. GXIMD04776]|uniref:DUF2254 domain-containing protein n=1 Tax=Halomonas sp. GXIMD04776 TaxID=3415605 RepID=UPI003CC48C14
MNSVLARPFRAVKNFRHSIAYLPSQLALLYLILGLAVVVPSIENDALPDMLNWLKFKDPETARALLSTLIAGMVSLMVFSFSMVMTVLSQAGGNFSHKLVFGLITERHHQRVLGHYLGTILFILILLIVPLKGETPSLWRSMGAYLGVTMVVHCLGLFVYFIHNASQSVQINAITEGLHRETRQALEHLESQQRSSRWRYMDPLPAIGASCHPIHSQRSGYIQNVDLEAVAEIAESQDAVVHINFSFGDYTVENFPLFKVEAPEEPDDAWCQKLLAQLVYVQGETVKDLYVNGLTQLMEIAIKALSPGINDPGTARLCLHQITELLIRRLKLLPSNVLADDQGHIRVTWPIRSFETLLYRLFMPILHYGREDISILLALLKALKTLSLYARHQELEVIQAHANQVVERLYQIARDRLDHQFINERLSSGEHRLQLPATLKIR